MPAAREAAFALTDRMAGVGTLVAPPLAVTTNQFGETVVLVANVKVTDCVLAVTLRNTGCGLAPTCVVKLICDELTCSVLFCA